MYTYRTHTCNELRTEQVGSKVKLSGWVNRKRDHSNLIFLDLRDHYGVTQCVINRESKCIAIADDIPLESVISVSGVLLARDQEAINSKLPTGNVELQVEEITVLSEASALPFQINLDKDCPEESRLKYRFLDLRREKMHKNIVLRSEIISSIRKRMTDMGFLEYQTPILTASSPEGARDFLVPSRLHPGQFYALPQAPQQFKQLLMVAGFDRYFQIAPCFRDEDARADRSPGEFYQLDLEMSFVTQEDVFAVLEKLLQGIFDEFSNGREVTPAPFPRIPFDEAMNLYGSDKPDLRNPLIIHDVDEVFRESDFSLFAKAIEGGKVVKAIPVPNVANQPRRFFDKLNEMVRDAGGGGLGYILLDSGEAKGPVAKFLSGERLAKLQSITGATDGYGVFFVCDKKAAAQKMAGIVRTRIAEDLELIEQNIFKFCWIVDFPMYERDETTGKIDFSHNPFSMPQGGLAALENDNPLDVKAYQYDIVCNGVELSSGAIRNHLPEVMYKAFEIAGYSKQEVENEFGGMLRAFKFGAPPHGGSAPGVDRIVMLLADEPNIREVVAFPLNQQAQDLLMQAPSQVSEDHLKELHLQIKLPPQKVEKA